MLITLANMTILEIAAVTIIFAILPLNDLNFCRSNKTERLSSCDFRLNSCKSQQASLAFGLCFLEPGNLSTIGELKPANDSRSDKHDHFPIFAPSVLKPSTFVLLLIGIGWP